MAWIGAPSDAQQQTAAGAQLSTWHWHALKALGLPVICLDARHAKAGGCASSDIAAGSTVLSGVGTPSTP